MPTLLLVGTPLDDNASPTGEAAKALREADLLIGESRKIAARLVKRAGREGEPPLFLLDNAGPGEWRALKEALETQTGTVALFSDGGMPILFDPGREVLTLCRKLKYRIRSVPGATSWRRRHAVSRRP